jgi:hypothetical protein
MIYSILHILKYMPLIYLLLLLEFVCVICTHLNKSFACLVTNKTKLSLTHSPANDVVMSGHEIKAHVVNLTETQKKK